MTEPTPETGGPFARVIADSVTAYGDRLTTMEVQTWRFVLAEFNTHRRFSRNSASSRAIPFAKQLRLMEERGLAYPHEWPKEQSGMQGGELFDADRVNALKYEWDQAATEAVRVATTLHDAGLHKSVINRLLEPFMWHRIVVSSTEWENFFSQRCSPLAQPEIRVTAELMQQALEDSKPVPLETGDWHLPYLQPDDGLDQETMAKVCAARCARVSYLTHDGVRDVSKDLELFERLVTADPPHWSPLEHVAYASTPGLSRTNFDGWIQYRQLLES